MGLLERMLLTLDGFGAGPRGAGCRLSQGPCPLLTNLGFPRSGLRGPVDVMDLGEEDEGGGD